MEYENIINLLDNTPNQTTKFRTKNWIEINADARGIYNTNSQIKFKTSMLKSNLCDYSDAYILVQGAITVPNGAVTGQPANNNGIEGQFKNCAPFIYCMNEINNTQIDNATDIGVVKPIYNLIEYSDKYSKTFGSLWKYYRDEPSLTENGVINNFPGNSPLFKSKQRITGEAEANGTKNVDIIVLLKYLSNF